MRRGDLSDLAAFVVIADSASFRLAATRLGVTPSALSHTMRQLEDRLGVQLLYRTTRSLSPTDAGMRLLERVRPAIEQIGGALADLDEEQQRPFGHLKISVHPVAVAMVIAPIWGRFLAAYPDVQLELRRDDAPIDIVGQGFDAGLGPRSWLTAEMTALRVMEPMKVAVVGAPGYFARRSPPRAPEDLSRHHCIQLRRGPDGVVLEWPFERHGLAQQRAVPGRLIVNSPDLALRAAVDGLGLAYTIDSMAELFLRTGQLVRVLEDWSPNFEGMFLYYPGRRQVPAALRALVEMINANRNVATAETKLDNPFVDA